MAQRAIREKQRREREKARRLALGAAFFSILLVFGTVLALWEVDSSITWLTGRETALQRFLSSLF